MDTLKQALVSQYRALFAMLNNVIHLCPEQLWTGETTQAAFCQIVYHSLFYTALYLSDREDTFIAWKGHRHKAQRLEALAAKKFTIMEMKDYLEEISLSLVQQIDSQDMDAASGFDWLKMTKAELHLYNMRHLQHHIGQLSERLHQHDIYGIEWIDKRPA